ncbi:MAG: DUF1572 domain-containing protein [Acidobacteria bacterium]|nr:MAG: DUF1572 domain-containing protein [Acidobacteriota bacterium]
MALEFTASCLADATSLFHYYKTMGERAFAQLSDAQLTAALDPEMNSIAQIVKHLAGNMRSRWQGFPDADGEKPDRNRDSEFEAPPQTRAAMIALWETGWNYVFDALTPLTDGDMARAVTIRGEKHSITQAVHRQLAHYAYHVGQIVFLAKHLQGAAWQSLSIPRGKSADFTRRVQSGETSQR